MLTSKAPLNHSRHKAILFILIAFITGSLLQAQAPSHDPSTMVRAENGRYWIFTTGQGIWCMSSSNANFSDWRAETTPFRPGTWPGWINSAVPGFNGEFWAPDIIQMNGYYYLYYSVSTFGSSRSAIGVVRTSSLTNPNWTDLGMVVSSTNNAQINAIDPALFTDTDGRVWMSYGSWFGGLGVVEINRATGKTIGNVVHLVGGNHEAMEAPYITKSGSYYYLFFNRGRCCNGVNSTYYVVVARSTSITGPYTNERVFLPNRNGNIIGPGHIGYGQGKLTYHYYDGNANGAAKLFVTTLGYRDGWPVAGITGDQSTGFNGTYSIIASHSNKALDVYDWGTSDGTNIAQYEAWGGDCQRFIISQVEGEWHSIKPVIATSKALDVNNISADNGANIQIWNYWGGDGQLFRFQGAGTGVYRIINKNSGKCLDVSGASMDNGANVLQWECRSGATNQMFRLSTMKSASLEAEDGAAGPSREIWPNPSKGSFTLQLPADAADTPAQVTVFDLSGRKVFETISVGKTQLTLDTNLQAGLYVLVVEQNNNSTTHKLQIE
ncbi:family 43 glycosylhydrolase [Geofilum rhodophaeum]|uniref:family 43 glycosylhydrolase n=1 Tax=Geofilum rhodophaeum TaxID=1965019 RepID=UPI000B526A0C|nr:family 43 glycosylhydrolase [Geofilum rhodophaeum]